MKFKEYLTESTNKRKETLNWVYGDIIEESFRQKDTIADDLSRKAFHNFLTKNMRSPTIYYDFVHETEEREKTFYSLYDFFINQLNIGDNGDINCPGNRVEIDQYLLVNELDWQSRIKECASFVIKCHGHFDMEVDSWWPEKTDIIHINSGNHRLNVSLSGIDKVVKHCEEIFIGSSDNVNLVGGLLGLILVNGLKEFDMTGSNAKKQPYKELREIINNNLGKGRSGVIAAQAELIEAGFEEYAKL